MIASASANSPRHNARAERASAIGHHQEIQQAVAEREVQGPVVPRARRQVHHLFGDRVTGVASILRLCKRVRQAQAQRDGARISQPSRDRDRLATQSPRRRAIPEVVVVGERREQLHLGQAVFRSEGRQSLLLNPRAPRVGVHAHPGDRGRRPGDEIGVPQRAREAQAARQRLARFDRLRRRVLRRREREQQRAGPPIVGAAGCVEQLDGARVVRSRFFESEVRHRLIGHSDRVLDGLLRVPRGERLAEVMRECRQVRLQIARMQRL
jgi:hypothetical protein